MIHTVGIVSLSSGILGEPLVAHEVALGLSRLHRLGLRVKFLPHAQMGMAYLQAHPEKRAEDLLLAFQDPEIDLILCAIGGDDTYRLAPYLFENQELEKAVTQKPFLGFSDTTLNHFMLHKVGLPTFYGQAFLSDVCELEQEMLPYTMHFFEELLTSGSISCVTPSPVWYESRKYFDADQMGVPLLAHPNSGFRLLQGSAHFRGKLLGGCIDSIYDMFDGERYADMPKICQRYKLFPDLDDWRGKILLLESSEECMSPEKYEKALQYLKNAGIFDVIHGILVGKPMDEQYQESYDCLLRKTIDTPALPIVSNLSIGHALPRCILPFGVELEVDAEQQCIRIVPSQTSA